MIKTFKRSMKSMKGFTLIELMVVVAIIGVLMAAGLAVFTTAQKTSRDARRLADVRAIGQALEQYRANNANYLPSASFTAGGAITDASNTYMAQIPTPPTGGTVSPAAYTYTVDVAATPAKYCICIGVENAAKGNATANASGVCTFATTGQTMFCVQNQQ